MELQKAACLILTLYLNTVAAISKSYMDKECGGVLNLADLGGAVKLRLTSRSSYWPNLDCSLRISSSSYADQFMLFFESFKIESSQGCANAWLEVHDGTSVNTPYVSGLAGKLCGDSLRNTVWTTSGNNLYLRFHSNSAVQRKVFDMVITQYHTGPCNNNSDFTCSNGRCISDSLTCNGYNPCGDYSDCVALAVGVIVAIVIALFVFIVILATVSIICCRRRRRRVMRGVYQPVNVVATTRYGTGYNPVQQPYPVVSPASYPTGQQYQNQPYSK